MRKIFSLFYTLLSNNKSVFFRASTKGKKLKAILSEIICGNFFCCCVFSCCARSFHCCIWLGNWWSFCWIVHTKCTLTCSLYYYGCETKYCCLTLVVPFQFLHWFNQRKTTNLEFVVRNMLDEEWKKRSRQKHNSHIIYTYSQVLFMQTHFVWGFFGCVIAVFIHTVTRREKKHTLWSVFECRVFAYCWNWIRNKALQPTRIPAQIFVFIKFQLN